MGAFCWGMSTVGGKGAQDVVRIVTAQSGRSFRFWKVSAWLTLSMINMNIAEQKGRGKWRYGLLSLFTGPLTTAFLTFGTSYAHLSGNVPTPAPPTYTMDQPVKTSIKVAPETVPTTTPSAPKPSTAPVLDASKKEY